MEARIWGSLPEHLLLKILSLLPLSSIARFRVVCKSWNELVSSRKFLASCAGFPSPGPWFMVYHTNKTHQFELSEQAAHKLHRNYVPPYPLGLDPRLMVSDGGALICSYNYIGDHSSPWPHPPRDISKGIVFVLNPVTNACRPLPPLDKQKGTPVPFSMCMFTNKTSKCYELFLISALHESRTFGIHKFISKKGCWHSVYGAPSATDTDGDLHAKLRFDNVCGQQPGLYSNGCVYFSYWDYRDDLQLIVYKIEEQVWSTIPTPVSNRTTLFYDLVKWEDRIFLITDHTTTDEGGSRRSLGLWELCKAKVEWLYVDAMPDSLFKEIFLTPKTGNRNPVRCAMFGQYLLLVSTLSWVDGPSRDVLYNFETKEWQMLQSSGQYNSKKRKHSSACNVRQKAFALAYEPGLDSTT